MHACTEPRRINKHLVVFAWRAVYALAASEFVKAQAVQSKAALILAQMLQSLAVAVKLINAPFRECCENHFRNGGEQTSSLFADVISGG
jgi:hypothetical protein